MSGCQVQGPQKYPCHALQNAPTDLGVDSSQPEELQQEREGQLRNEHVLATTMCGSCAPPKWCCLGCRLESTDGPAHVAPPPSAGLNDGACTPSPSHRLE